MRATRSPAAGDDACNVPVAVRLFASLIPAEDRPAILGDLVEDMASRGLRGVRRSVWLAGECGAIAAGLSFERARAYLVLPPVRELAAGLAMEGRGALRGAQAGPALLRALAYCGSVTAMMLGAELLVSTLMSAAGF